MEAGAGDSTSQGPVAPKGYLPCTVVVFNQLTAIPGQTSMYTECRAGDMRISNGVQWNMPVPFIGPSAVWIEGREYPLTRVHYWERAKTAFIKPATGPDHDYVLGKRAKREPRPTTPSK
jgi:hypothetical protein